MWAHAVALTYLVTRRLDGAFIDISAWLIMARA
jgi:hypothetical protein